MLNRRVGRLRPVDQFVENDRVFRAAGDFAGIEGDRPGPGEGRDFLRFVGFRFAGSRSFSVVCEDDKNAFLRREVERRGRSPVFRTPSVDAHRFAGRRKPNFGRFSVDAEGNFDVFERLIRLIRKEIDVRVFHRATVVNERRSGGNFAVRRAFEFGEHFVERQPPSDRSFAELPRFHRLTVDVAPKFVRELFHVGVGLRLILQTRRAQRFRAENVSAVGDELFNFRQQFRTHRFEFRQHENFVSRSVRQG